MLEAIERLATDGSVDEGGEGESAVESEVAVVAKAIDRATGGNSFSVPGREIPGLPVNTSSNAGLSSASTS